MSDFLTLRPSTDTQEAQGGSTVSIALHSKCSRFVITELNTHVLFSAGLGACLPLSQAPASHQLAAGSASTWGDEGGVEMETLCPVDPSQTPTKTHASKLGEGVGSIWQKGSISQAVARSLGKQSLSAMQTGLVASGRETLNSFPCSLPLPLSQVAIHCGLGVDAGTETPLSPLSTTTKGYMQGWDHRLSLTQVSDS